MGGHKLDVKSLVDGLLFLVTVGYAFICLADIPCFKHGLFSIDVELVKFMVRQFEFVEKHAIECKQIVCLMSIWPLMTFGLASYWIIYKRDSFLKQLNAFVQANLMLVVYFFLRSFILVGLLILFRAEVAYWMDRWVLMSLAILLYMSYWVCADDSFNKLRARFFPRFSCAKLKPIDKWLTKLAYFALIVVSVVGLAREVITRSQENVSNANMVSDAHMTRMNFSMPKATVLIGVSDSPVLQQDAFIGTGVLIGVRVGKEDETILVTAHHVANAVVALRGTLTIGIIAEHGVERVLVGDRRWFLDDKDKDLTFVDVSDCGLIKKSLDASCMVPHSKPKYGDKVFGVFGIPEKESFEPRTGWYLKNTEGQHLLNMKVEDGNSGSPIFLFKDGKISLLGICSRNPVANDEIILASPIEAVVEMIVKADKVGYFDPQVRNSVGPDISRGVELMQRLGVPGGLIGPSDVCWQLPREFTKDGKSFRVERQDQDSYSFRIYDDSGRKIVTGNYHICPSQADAQAEAFAYACTNKKLTMSEVVSRVSWNWIDDSKRLLHIKGVSGAHYLLYKNLLVVYGERGDNEVSSLIVDLVKAMER